MCVDLPALSLKDLPTPMQSEERVHAKPLSEGVVLQEECVRQGEYSYYSFELRQRKVPSGVVGFKYEA